MLGNLIGGFIAILVGSVLVPTVADNVKLALYHKGNISTPTNVTGSAATITGLTTIFYCLAIAASGIAVGTQALRAAGLLGM